MTRAARGTIVALGIALAAGPEVTPEHALADLRGPRDVARALEQLENDDDDDARVRAADWLAAHGPDEVVVPALLHALEEEQELGVTVPIALAVAQRARPSDAQGLLELEPTLRSPARAALVVTLAQLGTEESDAWLVRRLASPPGSELRPALEQVAEIARSRREALLSRVLDAIAEAPAPILVQWLASLEDERARATLVTLAISVHAVRATALEGLAHLGPDAETARRLVELGASPEGALRSPELVRALLAADPAAEIGAYLDEETLPALRATALDALVARAPARALEVLGSDPGAMRPTDRHVLEVAIAHPAAPLTPWLAHLVSDASVEPALRDGALEALVTMPGCVVEQAALRDAPLSDEVLALTFARIARRCPERQASVASGDGLEALHLRAIAGQDVREALADAWGGAREERLLAAHAWLAEPEADPRVLSLASDEDDPEVLAVLLLAARTHGLVWEGSPTQLAGWLESEHTRLAALGLALDPRTELSPRALRAIEQALRAPDASVSALALRVLEAHHPGSATAFACAAIDAPEGARWRAGVAVLRARAAMPACLTRSARIDPDLRRVIAEERPATDIAPLFVRVVSNVGGPLLRVSITTREGESFRVRPPRDGLVVVPGLSGADVHLRLADEPGDR